MVQGQADSVSIAAQGVVMQKDIRVQEMEVHTNRIAIDLLRTIFGHVELDTPLDATARVVLTEQDLNRIPMLMSVNFPKPILKLPI